MDPKSKINGLNLSYFEELLTPYTNTNSKPSAHQSNKLNGTDEGGKPTKNRPRTSTSAIASSSNSSNGGNSDDSASDRDSSEQRARAEKKK